MEDSVPQIPFSRGWGIIRFRVTHLEANCRGVLLGRHLLLALVSWLNDGAIFITLSRERSQEKKKKKKQECAVTVTP